MYSTFWIIPSTITYFVLFLFTFGLMDLLALKSLDVIFMNPSLVSPLTFILSAYANIIHSPYSLFNYSIHILVFLMLN